MTDEEKYNHLVGDCKAIITERLYNSQMELIEGYAEVGARIWHDPLYKKNSKGNQEFVEDLFSDIGIGKSTGYKCLQFYEKMILPAGDVYNALERLPVGKNISWNKIVNYYLLNKNGENLIECSHLPIVICKYCRKRLDDKI